MKCKNCGEEMNEKKYCTNCGSLMIRENETKTVENTENKCYTYQKMEYRQQPDSQENIQTNVSIQKNSTVSGLGIFSLIMSLSYFLGFVGLILAIIDLSIKNEKNKVLSIISVVIFGLFSLITIGVIVAAIVLM